MKQLLLTLFIAIISNATPIILEIEDGEINGPSILTEKTGFSGTGYVGWFENSSDYATVSTTIANEGTYNLKVITFAGGEKKEVEPKPKI